MRYFYIDTENRGSKVWVPHLGKLLCNDVVYVMYTQNSNHIPIQDTEKFIGSKCEFHYIETATGTPNALDFALVAKLAQQTMTARRSEHYIVSADKGYLSAIRAIRPVCSKVWLVTDLKRALNNKRINNESGMEV